MEKYVVVIGDKNCGVVCIGPFDSEKAAQEYIDEDPEKENIYYTTLDVPCWAKDEQKV